LARLDPQHTDALSQHLRRAVTTAALVTDPGPYMVITDLLPADVYGRLLETMPPPEAFEVADKVKANFNPLRATGVPESSREAWAGLHNDIVDDRLKPMLIETFRPFIEASYREQFGSELGDEVIGFRHHALSGRLMLRRPGYRLKPHRDMKIAALTGLIYFARPGDSQEYGTELYRVDGDQQAPFMKTYYPEAHGARAELVRTVPAVANSALVFMNVPGMAHGAVIPPDARQPERYAYQFYVGPTKSKLARLVRRLPPERAAAWSDLTDPDREY
jgi:hypothetical protein